MSSILSTMRLKVAEAIDGIDTVWTESNYTYKAFPSKEPASLRHKPFVVAMLDDQPVNDKQRARVGMDSRGTIGVKFAWAIRAGARAADDSTDVDAALDASIAIHKALNLIDFTDGWHLLHSRTTRDTNAEETLHLTTMLFTVTFRTPLQ